MVRKIGRVFLLGFSMLIVINVVSKKRYLNGYQIILNKLNTEYFVFSPTRGAHDELAAPFIQDQQDAHANEEASTMVWPTTTDKHNSSSQQNGILNVSQLEALMNEMLQSVSYMSDPVVDGIPTAADVSFLDGYKNPCWYDSSNQLTCMPYFFIGGFPKCGTTDLFVKLIRHPEIIKGRNKEPHWWTRQRSYGITFKFYTDYFVNATEVINDSINEDNYHPIVVTEASASTVWDNDNLFRSRYQLHPPPFLNIHVIHALLPYAKFVVITRNPVARTYSDYLFFQEDNSPEHFHSQVVGGIETLAQCHRDPNRSFLYCLYGRLPKGSPRIAWRLRIAFYYVHISILLTVYPRQQVYIVRLEDYGADNISILSNIFQFLNITMISDSELTKKIDTKRTQNANKRAYIKSGPMLNKTRALLEDFYRPYNVQLAKLLKDKRYLYE